MKCEQCGNKHNRKRFCSNKCKDRYHNTHNPRGLARYALGNMNHSDIAEMAGDSYASDWGEDGWRDDDSGVGKF